MTLYIFDVDGTLVRSFMRERSGSRLDGSAADVYDRVEALPGRLEKISSLASRGSSFALATNQAGAALGYQTFPQVREKMGRVAAEFSHFFGRPYSVHIAWVHPRAEAPFLEVEPFMRKPGPGLLFEALAAHRKLPSEAVFVGDMDTDREAALAAHVPYIDQEEFFASFDRR